MACNWSVDKYFWEVDPQATFLANSKHNRLSACGAPLDRSSTDVKILHLYSCHSAGTAHQVARRSNYQRAGEKGNIYDWRIIRITKKNCHAMLGAMKERRFIRYMEKSLPAIQLDWLAPAPQ